MRLITTSWDDGYPADHRLAELLLKYKVAGTFYVPKNNAEHEVMDEKKILELASDFEIGGHTINHVRMNHTSESIFEKEIGGCFQWLTDLVGEAPVSFCFPRGEYNQPAVAYTLKTGFKMIRTTELLNPMGKKNNELFPTTIQLYPHSTLTYFKHLIKRLKWGSLRVYFQSGMKSNLRQLVAYYLDHILQHGGCLHLWGHSWEIEEYNLWNELEEVLKLISNRNDFNYVQNGELINRN